MTNEIKVNLENLSKDEREQLMNLIEKANKESKVFKPELNEEYYFLNCDGEINYLDWNEAQFDKKVYDLGNCFKTKEEAKFMIERLKVNAELQRFADEHNNKIDWKNSASNKYFIFYNHSIEKVEIITNYSFKSNNIYFSSKEICEQAIKKIGENRIKKYYLRVEE